MLVLHAAGPAPACRPTMKPSSRTYRLLSVLLSLSLIGATVVAAAPHLRCAAASGHVAACCKHGTPPEREANAAPRCGHGAAPVDATLSAGDECPALSSASLEQAPVVDTRNAPAGPSFAAVVHAPVAVPTHDASWSDPIPDHPPGLLPPPDRPVLYAALLI